MTLEDAQKLRADNSTWPERVRKFWFETLGPEQWFIKDQALDWKITTSFQPLYEDLAVQSDQLRVTSATDTLSLIIVLDQFPRNMFRDTPRAFATDGVALRLAEEAIDAGLDNALSARERQFLYMPFQHSEDVEKHERSLTLYEGLSLESVLDFARRHKQVIDRFDRFGRFPHRNAILGRRSTDDELAYLKQPGSGF